MARLVEQFDDCVLSFATYIHGHQIKRLEKNNDIDNLKFCGGLKV